MESIQVRYKDLEHKIQKSPIKHLNNSLQLLSLKGICRELTLFQFPWKKHIQKVPLVDGPKKSITNKNQNTIEVKNHTQAG